MDICKGYQYGTTPCESTILFENGYCYRHQDQAPGGMLEWTPERLKAVIAAHGGPERVNLADVDLPGLHLYRFGLQRVCLVSANLKGAYLRSVNLQQANLAHTQLDGADLADVDLQGADMLSSSMRSCKITFSNLADALLADADLQGSTLSNTKLQGAELVDAKLQGANLSHANLQDTDLTHANLQGADLRYADLREVDLRDLREGGLLDTRWCHARLDRTLLSKRQLGRKIGDEQAGEYREARDAYLALKQNFEDLGDYDVSSWAYIKERRRYCQMLWISFHGVCPWSSHSQRIDYAAFKTSCSPLGKLTPA